MHFCAPLLPFLLLFVDSSSKEASQNDQADNPRCSEPRDKGSPCPHDGTAPAKKFYYNVQMGTCQPFVYLGCEGNPNRFESADECRRACANAGGRANNEWVLADQCNSTHLIPDGQYIKCSGGECPEGHQCAAASGVCCPSKDFVCSLRDDSGTFAEGVPDKPRFAWSSAINSCWRFSYYGAKGNYNNFASFHDCLSFCGGTKRKGN